MRTEEWCLHKTGIFLRTCGYTAHRDLWRTSCEDRGREGNKLATNPRAPGIACPCRKVSTVWLTAGLQTPSFQSCGEYISVVRKHQLVQFATETLGNWYMCSQSLKHARGQKQQGPNRSREIKKKWQEYITELNRKGLNDLDNHDTVVTHLEPDILECEVKWALGSVTKLVEVMEFQQSYLKSEKWCC